MFTLSARSRCAVAAASVAAFGAALLAGRPGTGTTLAPPAGLVAAVQTRLPTGEPAVPPLRDPFANEHARDLAVPPRHALPALPPNTAAPPFPFAPPPSSLRVVAIATGDHASALLDDGSHVMTVRVGDAVAGEIVRSIAADGIRLGDRRIVLGRPDDVSAP